MWKMQEWVSDSPCLVLILSYETHYFFYSEKSMNISHSDYFHEKIQDSFDFSKPSHHFSVDFI